MGTAFWAGKDGLLALLPSDSAVRQPDAAAGRVLRRSDAQTFEGAASSHAMAAQGDVGGDGTERLEVEGDAGADVLSRVACLSLLLVLVFGGLFNGVGSLVGVDSSPKSFG